MAKKRRRRPRQGTPGIPAATGPAANGDAGDGDAANGDETSDDATAVGDTAAPATREPRGSIARRDRPPLAGGRLSERMRAPSPYPRVSHSLGRGVITAGGSPTILLTGLLYVGVLWIVLLALGLEVFPTTLVEAMGFPPFGPYLTDIFLPTQIYGLTATALAVSIALTALRSVVWAVLIGTMLESIEFGKPSMVGVLQGLRAFNSVFLIMLFNVMAVIFSNLILPVFLGPLGQLALAAVLFGGIYLLPFAGPAAVRGPRPPREAMRLSARAARLPGPRHVIFVILYFFVAVMLVTLLPGHSIVTANPSLAEWAWTLGGTFVQMVFLAAVCERWLAVEDQVPAGPAPRRARVRR
jgi:hypothetical protein